MREDIASDLPFDFAEIAGSAPALIWVSNERKEGVWFNKTWLDYTGAKLEEELGDGWLKRICADDLDAIEECADAFAARRPFRTEFRLRRADGTYRWMIDTGEPRLGPDGSFKGFVGSLVEIEDRKLAEHQLRLLNDRLEEQVALRTRELEEALQKARKDAEEKLALEQAFLQSQKIQTLGQLTGGIAHDFNNLLTPVLGGLQLVLAMSKEPSLTPLLEGAIASAQRGAELTKRLLTFSRLHKLDIKPVQLREMLLGMQDLLNRTLGPLIQVRLEAADDDVNVSADRTQLEMAVLNLAINARDAMPEGGTVRITTIRDKVVTDRELPPGEYVQVCVSDHGRGMTPEVAAQAFDPFFTTKQLGAGTGLGLSMVYALAQQCGGAVRLETELGHGTTVRLFLPVSPNSLSPVLDQAHEAVTGHTRQATVLVVDDDLEVRDYVAFALKSVGHRVLTASGGQEALSVLEKQTPDLLITDYAMPEMTGAELASCARARNPLQRIIYISGLADLPALERGASDAPLLKKPFAPHELFATVQQSLAR